MAARQICVQCGAPTKRLYREYSKDSIRLWRCRVCGRDADPYIEFDALLLLLDLVLLHDGAWRHLLFNRLPRRTGSLQVLVTLSALVLAALTYAKMWLYAADARQAGLRLPHADAAAQMLEDLKLGGGAGAADAGSASFASMVLRVVRLLPPWRLVEEAWWFWACSLLESLAFLCGVIFAARSLDLRWSAPPATLAVGCTLAAWGEQDTGEQIARWVLEQQQQQQQHMARPAPPVSSRAPTAPPWSSAVVALLQHLVVDAPWEDEAEGTVLQLSYGPRRSGSSWPESVDPDAPAPAALPPPPPVPAPAAAPQGEKRPRGSSLSDSSVAPPQLAVDAAITVSLMSSAFVRALFLLALVWDLDPAAAVVINGLALVTNVVALRVTLAVPASAASLCVAAGALACAMVRLSLWATDLLFAPLLLV